MKKKTIVVTDLMQEEYVYTLTEPAGRNFHPGFTPELTPREMLALGVFGGKYMTDCTELVGDVVEAAIETILSAAGIGYRKTKRAEHVHGFDQAPDFIIPDEFNPHVVIEAKLSEDDGTARDKITRIQHLAELSTVGTTPDNPRFEVVACIAGRGFGVRREDMKKLLLATRGKVFTLKTLGRSVDSTNLREFASK